MPVKSSITVYDIIDQIRDYQENVIVIEQINGTVFTQKDVQNTKRFHAKLLFNGKEQQLQDQTKIKWYLNGTEFTKYVSGDSIDKTTVEISFDDIQGDSQELKVEYTIEDNVKLTNSIIITKIQTGNPVLVITASNGVNLSYQIQSTTLTQNLYIDGSIQIDDVEYVWYANDVQIKDQTQNNIEVTLQDISGSTTYKCIAKYKDSFYTQELTIVDYTDKYTLFIKDKNGNDIECLTYHMDISDTLENINLEIKPALYKILPNSTEIVKGTVDIVMTRNDRKYIVNNFDNSYPNYIISAPLSMFVDEEEIRTNVFNFTINISVSYSDWAAKVPIPITLSVDLPVRIVNKKYSWLQSWQNNTTIDNESIATGKLFVGHKNEQDGKLSGVYIGDGTTLDSIQQKASGYDTAIVQLKDGYEFFKVLNDTSNNFKFFVGNDESYIKFKAGSQNTFELKSTGVLINNSGFELTDGTINLGSGAIVLNTDGSGQLASGNITWQTNGNGNLANTLVWDNSGNVTISNKLYIKNDSNQITFALGKNVTTGKDGLYLDENNYWFTTGEFKVGNANTYVVWDGQNSLAVKGNIYAQGGTIDGDLAVNANLQAGNIMIGKNQAGTNKPGIVVNSNNYWYLDSTTPKFKVGNTNQYILWDGQNLNIYGNIYAQGGSISGDLIVNNTITQSKIDVNNLFSQSIEITGNMHSNGHQNFNDAGAGFWIGKDGSQYKFVVGNRADQKYLEFDGSKTHQVGDLFGQFIGDTYLYNVEIKKDNTYPNSVVYAQDIPQVYRYEETGLELLRTYGSNQHYIVSLQNAQIKPAGVYSPKTGSKTEGQVTDWTTITNPSGTSLTSATGTVFYKIEVQVFKYFPADYFKGKSEGEYAYQTLIFDFSDDVLYNTSYTQSNNTATISFDPQNRTVTVSLTGVTTSKTLQQRSDITQIKARAYIANKPQSSQVDAGMHYTFTTKDMGHQLAMITIDPDAQRDTLTNFNPDSSSNNVYGIIHQRTFNGVATQAYFADLQEYIWSNEKFEPGTPVQIKKGKVVQQYNPWKKTWIVSTKPGFVMGKGRKNSVPVALAGTVEVNLKQNIDDELCLTLDGKLKVATWLDKIVGKYIIGRVVKILEDGCRLIFLY